MQGILIIFVVAILSIIFSGKDRNTEKTAGRPMNITPKKPMPSQRAVPPSVHRNEPVNEKAILARATKNNAPVPPPVFPKEERVRLEKERLSYQEKKAPVSMEKRETEMKAPHPEKRPSQRVQEAVRTMEKAEDNGMEALPFENEKKAFDYGIFDEFGASDALYLARKDAAKGDVWL